MPVLQTQWIAVNADVVDGGGDAATNVNAVVAADVGADADADCCRR